MSCATDKKFIQKPIHLLWARVLMSWFFVQLSLLIFACAPERRDVDELTTVRHLLNHRQYEDAIQLLELLHRSQPQNAEFRLLLSSALVGSVGFNIVDAFDALEDKLFNKPLLGQSAKSHHAFVNKSIEQSNLLTNVSEVNSQEKMDSLKEFERDLVKFSITFRDGSIILVNLPYFTHQDRKRIVQSLTLLKDISPESEEYVPAQLYSAILSVIQFINYFRDAVPYENNDLELWYFSLFCNTDQMEIFIRNLDFMSYYLASAFESLNQARRFSDHPIYEHLAKASQRLMRMRDIKNQEKDIFNLSLLMNQLSNYVQCH